MIVKWKDKLFLKATIGKIIKLTFKALFALLCYYSAMYNVT